MQAQEEEDRRVREGDHREPVRAFITLSQFASLVASRARLAGDPGIERWRMRCRDSLEVGVTVSLSSCEKQTSKRTSLTRPPVLAGWQSSPRNHRLLPSIAPPDYCSREAAKTKYITTQNISLRQSITLSPPTYAGRHTHIHTLIRSVAHSRLPA